MSKYACRLISPLAAMVAIMVMGMATSARADVEIWVSTNGTTYQQLGTSGATFSSGSGTVGGFSITQISASTNLTGSPTDAYSFGTQTNISSSAGGTLYIVLAATGYLQPITPPDILMHSNISPTKLGGKGSQAVYNSYVDTTNAGAGTSGYTFGGGYNTVTQTETTTGIDDKYTVIPSNPGLGSPYSLIETFKLTLGSGGQFNSSSTTELTSLPEPSTMALAGLGALGLIGYGVRRRKAMGA